MQHPGIEKFTNLKREKRDGRERPYKPLVLLAAIDLIEEQACPADKIPWGPEICDRFNHYFEIVSRPEDSNNITDPFPRLHTDGIWNAIEESSGHHHRGRITKSLFGKLHAIPEPDVAELFSSPHLRQELRNILISRYFSDFHKELQYCELNDDTGSVQERAEHEEIKVARKASFRREIAELYDEKCAACGLRIKLPNRTVSFIDAAHLIPFSHEHNDHPSNGMALCKHHHWVMDQKFISPGPDLKWHVSHLFDEGRSAAESDLIDLRGTDIILPNDKAFYPSERALKWRYDQLLLK